MHNNIDFNQFNLLNGYLILLVIAALSLIYGFAYVQLKKRYKKRYEVLLAAFEIEATSFYEVMKKHNQSKAKLSDGFIFRVVELAKLADQLHLVGEDNKQRWQELLHDIYAHMEEKINLIKEEDEHQQTKKQLLMQKIATLRELV